MSLLERLNNDMKIAMRSKDKHKLAIIRMVKSSLQNEAINLGVDELSSDEELTILSREVKQLNESLQEFKTTNREDLIQKLELELEILRVYLPTQLTEEEIVHIVVATAKELNVTSKNDFGKLMGTVMPKLKGKADGSIVKQYVQNYFN